MTKRVGWWIGWIGIAALSAQGGVIWEEDFESALIGARSTLNSDLPGTAIASKNGQVLEVVPAPANWIGHSGQVAEISTVGNQYEAIVAKNMPITFPAAPTNTTYTLSFDLYIPATLAKDIGDIQPRFSFNGSTDAGSTDASQVEKDAGIYNVEYTGQIRDLITTISQCDGAAPFIGFDQGASAVTGIAYIDNISFELDGVVIPPPSANWDFSDLRSREMESTPLVKWQHFGPGMSGYIDSFWINNGDPNAMYDALDMGNGHVTLNRGAYWTSYRGVDGTGGDPGGVTSVDFSYQDPNFGLMTGKNMTYSTTDRGRSWDRLVDTHPEAGNSQMHSVIAVDPGNDDNWYIGAGQSMNIKGCHYNQNGITNSGNFSAGFIMYSKNRGRTWTEVSTPFPSDSSFSRIIADPRDSNLVYASCQHGVYKSTDGGVSWDKVAGNGLPYNQPRDMGFYYNEEADEFLLYIIEITHYDIVGSDIVTSGGVYRSADGGTNWENMTGDLAIDLPRVNSWGYREKYYRAVSFWLEMDQTLFKNTYNLPTNTFSQFHQMAVDPTNKDRVYLVHNFKHDFSFPPGNIWMTENGGTNWFAAAREGTYWKNETDKSYWQSRAVQPLGINTKFAHVEKEHNEADNTGSGPRFVRCNQLGEIYTCFAQQMMRSVDNGATWNQIDDDETEEGSGHWVGRGNSNLPGETFCLDTRTPGIYLWGSGEHGLWRNTDDGDKVYPGAIAVEQLTGQSHVQYDSLSMSSIAVHPTDNQKIYTLQFRQGNRGALRYSPDNGASWQTLSTPVNFPGSNDVIFQHSLLIDHEDPNNMYFCIPLSEWQRWSGDSVSNGRQVTGEPDYFGQGIYKSTNGGIDWNMITNGIPADSSVYRMAMDPIDPEIIYAALNETHERNPGGLFKTTDGGANWTRVNLPGNVVSVNQVQVHKTTRDIYIACGAWTDHGETGGGFVSRDGGESWELLFDMPYLRHFSASLADPDVMVANVDKAQSIGSRNPGAYVSIDGGTKWFKINYHHGQPEGIRKIEADPHNRDVLWMSLHGTGFFRADISGLRTGNEPSFFWDWMEDYGESDIAGDRDGDQFNNYSEFIADTDPGDENDYFKFEFVSNQGTGGQILFDSTLNRTYSVEYAEDLTGVWSVLTNGISGTGGSIELYDTSDKTNRFYKIKVELE
ncbi:VPS10 domain-containing protein [Pontiella agarivorans]|uniref:Sortilin N-terminal domain-containing protein n=1 Tax=Pontiella agarivorans TaxID=3038953 RepID=A0ABU5MWC3_9BACT|nr:hypothetical protein [Pontiella agarivorans]MDZ8118462.1 hypothetical protein [Pontiella agarivorans]